MALIKPIALPLSAFDATNIQRFSFTASGGDRVFGNKITIKEQSDDSIVYSSTVESFEFFQDVPANTLQNGVGYTFYFNTYDINGTFSEDSNTVFFYCYTQPTIEFSNIPEQGIVESVSYTFRCVYNQLEGEKIQSLVFNLYNNQGTLIDYSETLYTTDTPPNIFEHTFNDLLEERYYIEAIGTTIEGTAVTSGRIQFTVQYSEPIIYETLKLKNNAKDGNINIYTNLIAIDGYSDGQQPIFIDGMLDLSRYGSYVLWKTGFEIPESFTMQILMKPCLIANFITLRNDDVKIDIGFKREIPNGESTVKDCFYVREQKIQNSQTSIIRSNYVDLINNNSYVCVWVKKIRTVWDLRLGVVNTTDNFLDWNIGSNVEYNKTTDFPWYGELYSSATDVPVIYDFNSLYPLNNVKIYNGVFDNIYITRNTDIEYTTTPLTEWDVYTILHCAFNNTINAGNISINVSQISNILIKRRAFGETSWLKIVDKKINGLEDININVYDYFSPNKTTMEYAIVPVVDGIESSYIISSILSCFNGFYITDGRETYKLYEATNYSNNKESLRSGVHETLGGVYPIITYNSNLNYKSFSIEGLLLGYEFETTRKINRKSVLKQTEDLSNFLKNKKKKLVKDWNGNIYLGSIVEDITPSIDLVNGYNRILFSFVEQGKYNNQTDYDNSDLIVQ